MRLWARRNGLSLSEKDLRPRYTEEIKGEPIPGLLTEEDVFKFVLPPPCAHPDQEM
jgi:hypothetical protein